MPHKQEIEEERMLCCIMPEEANRLQPVTQGQRFAALDILRGMALLGVLLVNLLSDFRIPLAQRLLTFHTSTGWADRAVDIGVAIVLEFKSITLFSLLFGAGAAVFTERAAARGVGGTPVLVRRYLVLLVFGVCHLLLIWNGDILTLYALCGFLLLPLLRLPTTTLTVAGILLVTLSLVPIWGFLWPGDATLRGLAAEGALVYSQGHFGDVVAFHWRETGRLILPLLLLTLPKTWGLMALGAAAWRWGVLREPAQYRGLLWAVTLTGVLVGGATTLLSVYAASIGKPSPVPSLLLEAGSTVPLALAYAAGLLLALRSPTLRGVLSPFAAAGQMALTNYLMQSVALSLLFYGYGLGLAGRLGSAAAALVGIILYSLQVMWSGWWLQRYQFGPVEWFWRSLTYGRWQPLQRIIC